MRVAALAFLALLGVSSGFVPAAAAGTKVVVKTKTYAIVGQTGQALLRQMDRKGPKHGFMTRAIAQTGYRVKWEFKVARVAGVCHLVRADATLTLTYIYPEVASPITPSLRKRWTRFYAGVRAHEREHGRMAREMVDIARKSIVGLKLADGRRCDRMRREARNRIEAVYDGYEAKQVAFDEREHRDGGKVERLVAALVGR